MPILPAVEDRSREFWTTGEAGVLKIQRCTDCGYFLHPPDVMCPICGSDHLEYETVSGDARLYSYTVYFGEVGGVKNPVTGVVELVEQAGLLLACDLSGRGDPDRFELGTSMRVEFQNPASGLYMPQFAFS